MIPHRIIAYTVAVLVVLLAGCAGAEKNDVLHPATPSADADTMAAGPASLPRQWINLELSDSGYVLYDPCDGDTPTITIDRDTLRVGYALEPVSYPIDALRATSDSTYQIEASDRSSGMEERFTIAIRTLDRATGMALWKWTGVGEWGGIYKKVYVPAEKRDRFKVVVNPCDTVHNTLVPEFQFRTIEEE